MQHQKVSWVLECHAGYKNAVNLGHIRPSNPLLGGSASFEQGRGICVPEARRDAWVSRRCMRFLLLFSQFYSAKAQFQPSPGPPVFAVGRGQEDFWRRRHLISPAYIFIDFIRRFKFLSCPWTVPLQCWLSWDGLVISGVLNAMTKQFPSPGSTHLSCWGWRPYMDPNLFLYCFPLLLCWSAQPELFISPLKLASHESKSWYCLFPQTLKHFSQGSSLL